MKHLKILILKINRILIEDRDLLSNEDVKILEDCLELISIIQKTKDDELKKIRLLDLTLKLTTFFN